MHVPAIQCKVKKPLHDDVLNTLKSTNTLKIPNFFGIWGGTGKAEGLLQWAWGPLLALAVPKASSPPLQVAHEVLVRQGRGPCSHSNYSVPIIMKNYKSKHGKIFCVLKRGAISFSCLFQALRTQCPTNSWNSEWGEEKRQEAHFSPVSRILPWLSFTIPPSTGKSWCGLTHKCFHNSSQGQAETRKEWQSSSWRCRLAL